MRPWTPRQRDYAVAAFCVFTAALWVWVIVTLYLKAVG